MNGKVITNWSDFFEQATSEQVFLRGKPRNVPDITENKVLSGIIVPAGKGIQLIRLGASAQIASYLRSSENNAEIALCYCSFYDECWLTTNNSMEQQLVRSCRVLNAPDFVSLDDIN